MAANQCPFDGKRLTLVNKTNKTLYCALPWYGRDYRYHSENWTTLAPGQSQELTLTGFCPGVAVKESVDRLSNLERNDIYPLDPLEEYGLENAWTFEIHYGKHHGLKLLFQWMFQRFGADYSDSAPDNYYYCTYRDRPLQSIPGH